MGRWKEVNGTETISFLQDNSVEVNSGTTFGSTTQGTFEHPDKSHVRISMKGLLGVDTKTFEYKIEGNQMTLTELNGNSVVYSRVKE